MKKIVFLVLFIFSVFCMSATIEIQVNKTQIVDDYVAISLTDSGYYVSYSNFDSLIYSYIVDNDQTFFKLDSFSDNSFDYLELVGKPNLPIKSINLQLPRCYYNLSNDLLVSNLSIEYESFNISNHYYPYQSIPNSDQIDVFDYDTSYYNSTYVGLDSIVRISDTYLLNNTTGITVNILPVIYSPLDNMVWKITSLNFNINFNVDYFFDLKNKELINGFGNIYDFDLLSLSEYSQICNSENINLLIITVDDSYKSKLNPFILNRENSGFNVTTYLISDILTEMNTSILTPTVIREFLYNKYSEADIENKMDYLLIVGHPCDIPYSSGVVDDISNPATDIYYGCIEQPTVNLEKNFFPEFYVGRWSIVDLSEIDNVYYKINRYETYMINQNNKFNSLLLSGIDRYSSFNCGGNDNYKLICKISDFIDIGNNTLIDGRKFDNQSDTSIVRSLFYDALGENLNFFVYSGHGSIFSLGCPIELSYDYAYKNYDIPPISFSFACSTNSNPSFSGFSSFGSNWVGLNKHKGGVTHFGATTLSYSDSNKYLATNIFKLMKDPLNMTVGRLCQVGAGKYYNACKTNRRRRQVERYLLFGDPSLKVVGDNSSINNSSVNNSKSNIEIINDLSIFENQRNNTAYNIELYSVDGKYFGSFNNIVELKSITIPGVYVAYINMSNNKYIYKFQISNL